MIIRKRKNAVHVDRCRNEMFKFSSRKALVIRKRKAEFGILSCQPLDITHQKRSIGIAERVAEMNGPRLFLLWFVFGCLRALVGETECDSMIVLKNVGELKRGGVAHVGMREIKTDPVFVVVDRLKEKPRFIADHMRIQIV